MYNIQRPRPINTDRRLWHNHYNHQIIDMFFSFKGIVKKSYPNSHIDWKSNELFNDFSSLLFQRSSKFID